MHKSLTPYSQVIGNIRSSSLTMTAAPSHLMEWDLLFLNLKAPARNIENYVGR